MPVFLEWYGNPVIVSLLFPYHTPIIFKRYGILSKACQHFPYQMPEFFSWYGNHVKASMLFPYHTLVFFKWYGIHGKACHRFPYHTPIFFNRYGIHVKTCCGFHYKSSSASFACLWMKLRRGVTSLPISISVMSLAMRPSSISTLRSFLLSGSSVVSQSCSASISPRPL